jgi:hypothetical protein
MTTTAYPDLAVDEIDAHDVEIADDIASADAYRAHRASNPVTDVGMYLRPAIDRLIRGSLKARKIGRDWLVTAREVERYRLENRRGAA